MARWSTLSYYWLKLLAAVYLFCVHSAVQVQFTYSHCCAVLFSEHDGMFLTAGVPTAYKGSEMDQTLYSQYWSIKNKKNTWILFSFESCWDAAFGDSAANSWKLSEGWGHQLCVCVRVSDWKNKKTSGWCVSHLNKHVSMKLRQGVSG